MAVQGQGLGATAALAAAALQPKLAHRCILIDPCLSELHPWKEKTGLPAPPQHLEADELPLWDALYLGTMVACPTLLVVPHSAGTWPWVGTVQLQAAIKQATWQGYVPDGANAQALPADIEAAIRHWCQK